MVIVLPLVPLNPAVVVSADAATVIDAVDGVAVVVYKYDIIGSY
jgi:hypothetical protein